MHVGTAGLRALDGPGFNRMNTITVKQTTQGLVGFLQQQQATGWDLRCGDGSPNLLSEADYLHNGIVVGYDGRTHSREYAPARNFWSHHRTVPRAPFKLCWDRCGNIAASEPFI
jgi:phosphomannomutase